MADDSSLANLLERASHIFTLAGDLGSAFYEARQYRAALYTPDVWESCKPTFEEYCNAIAELSDAMQHPPKGSEPVVEQLLKAARIAKRMRELIHPQPDTWNGAPMAVGFGLKNPGPPAFTSYLEFFPELNSVFQDGFEAIKQVTKTARLDDPFAFLDDIETKENRPPSPAEKTPVAKKHVFLSYCRDNKGEVSRLREDLIDRGESVWWDQDIMPGKNWKQELRHAMKDACAVVACFSKEVEERTESGMFPELREAIEAYKMYAPGSIYLIPVRLSDCTIPDFEIDSTSNLSSIQYVDLFPEPDRSAGLDSLTKALRQAPHHP